MMNSALLWNAAENKRKIPKIQSEFLAFKFRGIEAVRPPVAYCCSHQMVQPLVRP